MSVSSSDSLRYVCEHLIYFFHVVTVKHDDIMHQIRHQNWICVHQRRYDLIVKKTTSFLWCVWVINIFWGALNPKQKSIPSTPTILSTSTDCPPCSLLSVHTSSPLSCSLLMYRLSVQKRKACLLRWRVLKKGRHPVRCPTLPLPQFSRQNNRSLSPCRVCSPSRRPPPTRVSCKVQINGFVDIRYYH